MKKLRKFAAVLLALSMSAASSMSVFAAEIEPEVIELGSDVAVSVNEEGETVYTQTFDLAEVMAAYKTKTATGGSKLEIALAAGESRTTDPVNFRFTTVTENAKVKSVEFIPGRAIVNNNDPSVGGCVVFNTLYITSPSGDTASTKWIPTGVTDKTSFLNQSMKGVWKVYASATNIAEPTGRPFEVTDGNLIYESPRMTITYTE